jgi:periplasmic divalent cation tolerance protein
MSEENPYIIITTTVDSPAAALAITNALLLPRLAACVQTTPIQSTFWWNGEMERATEIRLQAKAPEANAEAIMAAIEAVHPYEVPEIIITPILDGHPAYLEWIDAETRVAGEKEQA